MCIRDRSGAHEAWSAYLGGAIFGLGACFLWPTMLAITSERFPKGGAVLLGLMGSIGNIGAFLAAPIMGRVQDFNLAKGLDEVEAGMLSLRYVIVLPIVVAVIFGAIYLLSLIHICPTSPYATTRSPLASSASASAARASYWSCLLYTSCSRLGATGT